MKSRLAIDFTLFIFSSVVFYILMTYIDVILLVAFPQKLPEDVFEGYSNPLDMSTLIGGLGLTPVALQTIEDRGSRKARLLAHKSKKIVLRVAPLIAGASAAFEAKTAFRIIFDVEAKLYMVGKADAALLVTSKWLPHYIFLFTVVLIPTLWEWWLPESKKEMQLELASLNERIDAMKIERSEFFDNALVFELGVWKLNPVPEERPIAGFFRTSYCLIYALALPVLGLVILYAGVASWGWDHVPIFLSEVLLFFAMSVVLIFHCRKILIGWKVLRRWDRPSELYAVGALVLSWLFFAIGIAFVSGFYLEHDLPFFCGRAWVNPTYLKVRVCVAIAIFFILFMCIVWYFSVVNLSCRFGIEQPLKALAFARMLEIEESIKRMESGRKRFENKLNDSLGSNEPPRKREPSSLLMKVKNWNLEALKKYKKDCNL